jgi:hypothetical protein
MHKTSNSLPQAFVSVGKNKSRLKIYNGKTVFIKDGEEFQIELFNPTTKTIGAKIFINGNSISNSMLVIKPGERSYLERYLDDNKKFLFETYNVEDSKEVKEAIKQNGLIKVEFYNEKIAAPLIQTWGSTTTPYYYTTPLYNNTIIIGDPNLFYVGSGGSGIVNCSTSDAYTGGAAKLKTGRIEKGDVSNQVFGSYYGDFESYYFASTEYHLMPESQKPVEVKEIRQYCPGCRTRVKKSSWKFCPSCGESLD